MAQARTTRRLQPRDFIYLRSLGLETARTLVFLGPNSLQEGLQDLHKAQFELKGFWARARGTARGAPKAREK